MSDSTVAPRESVAASAPIANKLANFIAREHPHTPFLFIDLDVVASNYRTLQASMPQARIYYAVKANPAYEVVKLLAELGCSFDAASPAEIDLVLAAGAAPERISYGNTIKKETDIALAFERGVRLFAFDAEEELEKIARSAPGSKVFCRLLTNNEGADWPLSRKFGCEPDMAQNLLNKARDLGLQPIGLSFHVGSQQTRLDQWEPVIEQCAKLFASLKTHGIELRLVNLGGGLPAHYQDKVEPVGAYSAAIMEALHKHFGDALPEIVTEPGRSLVGDAGILETEVVLVSKKSYADEPRWVYLDVGKFGGLAETHEEAIKYRIEVVGGEGPTSNVVIAGPSCDSVDILYENYQYQLPLSLKSGDHLRFYATGAYTASYSSVGFNGFEPLKTYCR